MAQCEYCGLVLSERVYAIHVNICPARNKAEEAVETDKSIDTTPPEEVTKEPEVLEAPEKAEEAVETDKSIDTTPPEEVTKEPEVLEAPEKAEEAVEKPTSKKKFR